MSTHVAEENYIILGGADSSESAPDPGTLLPIPTKAEVEKRSIVNEGLFVGIPVKRASRVLKSVDGFIAQRVPNNSVRHQHLRKLVRLDQLPEQIRSLIKLRQSWLATAPSGKENAPPRSNGTHTHRSSTSSAASTSSQTRPEKQELFMLIAPIDRLSPEDLGDLKKLVADEIQCPWPLEFYNVTVPGSPPTSIEQAEEWSQRLWPTSFKKHNPYGPHAALVERAAVEIRPSVPHYMRMARAAADATSDCSRGRSVGVTVVDRYHTEGPKVVMVAGDARRTTHQDSEGSEVYDNVMGHAAMRAIGLIARRRREAAGRGEQISPQSFLDMPLTAIEQQTYDESFVSDGGYLCVDLDFYLTHEPCVMCSMALLHSRAGRVIFEKHMPDTGGLVAGDPGSAETTREATLKQSDSPHSDRRRGYGLFWRPSLNWKFLTWRWVDSYDRGQSTDTSFNA